MSESSVGEKEGVKTPGFGTEKLVGEYKWNGQILMVRDDKKYHMSRVYF